MKLLVTTQVVNKNDTNLGFFHEWLARLAGKVEKLYVVCLYEGEHDLPPNVKVISLGKEKGRASRWVYAWRFRKAVKSLNKDFESVFIHMNPEYAILGKIFGLWKGKKVLLWYVHKAVNLRLKLAEKFVTKIFTASKDSFRLESKKVEVVGHGIQVEMFADPNYVNLERLKKDTLFLLGVGRISRSKDWESVILAAAELKKRKISNLSTVLLLVAGEPIGQKDEKYAEYVNKLSREVTNLGFAYKKYPHVGLFKEEGIQYVYQSSHILIHTSRTGSFDKVVLEALAAGRVVVTTSEAYKSLAENELKNIVFYCPPGNPEELVKTIENIWVSGILKELPLAKASLYVKENHNLDTLVTKIVSYLS